MVNYNLIREHKHNKNLSKKNELRAFDIEDARREAKFLLLDILDAITDFKQLKSYVENGKGDYELYIEKFNSYGCKNRKFKIFNK